MKTSTRINKIFNKVFDNREAEILRMRFGMDWDGIPKTLEEVGRAFNISRERIRQLESGALGKLRDSGQLEKFEGYLAIKNNPVGTWLRTVSVCLRAENGGKK